MAFLLFKLHLLSESECAFPQTPEQGSPNLILEGRCPAEFSLPQHTCLQVPSIPSKTLISCFRCLIRVGAKLCRTPALQDRVSRASLTSSMLVYIRVHTRILCSIQRCCALWPVDGKSILKMHSNFSLYINNCSLYFELPTITNNIVRVHYRDIAYALLTQYCTSCLKFLKYLNLTFWNVSSGKPLKTAIFMKRHLKSTWNFKRQDMKLVFIFVFDKNNIFTQNEQRCAC